MKTFKKKRKILYVILCGVCVENGIRKKFLFFVTVGRALLCENKQKTTKKLERICIQESNETKRNDGRVGWVGWVG